MSVKRLIWIGAIVGSTLGGLLPSLWHASMWSMSGLVLSTIGGLVGIWAGWKVSQRL
jgi:uncharacterized membrane protein YeaQ/YmgE (transglycosylase-associated protein family)